MNLLKIGALCLALTHSTNCFAADYEIDASHTKITFKVRHLGISWVPGSFTKLKGNFSFDEKEIAKSKAEASIEVDSVNTENQKRDEHLKSEDFFAAPKFPEIKFVSKEIRSVKGNKFEVVGDLTMHGVTKPIVLDAEYFGLAKDPYGNERAGFSAVAKLNRKDFGLQWSKLLETGAMVVGDEVSINLDVEGIKKKEVAQKAS